MAGFEYDKEYKQRILSAVQEALMRASHDEATNVMAIRSKEASDALVSLIAFVVGTSPSLNSPTKVREFCDDVSKQLRRGIASVKEAQAKGKLDFMTVLTDENRH